MTEAFKEYGSDMTRPFWHACRNGELLVPRCNRCGKYFFAPEVACIHCWSTDWNWQPSSGRGVLQSYSIVHKAPLPGLQTPFVFAVIDMAEGWSLFSNLVDCDEDVIRIDMSVEVTFRAGPDGRVLPMFKPGFKPG